MRKTIETATSRVSADLPTVLIATDDIHEAQYIGEALEKMGYNTIFSQYDGRKLIGTPVKAPRAVLFVFSNHIDKTPAIVKALKSHYDQKDLPFVGALTRQTDIDLSAFDTLIFPPAHISQIANRVSSMIRLGQMEKEIGRRIETIHEDFGITYKLSADSLNKPFRILFIGKASPEFMVIINALQKKNVEVVAAFTSFSAFDYLHEHEFDAVVMNALAHSEPALTISETMRRNAKLYHVPTLFVVDADVFTEHDIAYEKGASDIISTRAETEEISGRILELANYHRIHSQLKEEFSKIGDESCQDIPSGVFNKAFFSAHLDRICKSVDVSGEPLSLLVIKVAPNAHYKIPTDKVSAAMSQLGKMFQNLVRMQDVTARLSEDTFVIAFPEQNTATVGGVIGRISSIIDCAAFDSGNSENGPFTMIIETTMVEKMPHDNAEDLINNALSELAGEPVALQDIAS